MAADVYIAGGGTGGHVYPALAIADAIVEDGLRKRKTDIHFVGSKRGLEAKVVPGAGYSITLLSGRGIPRTPSVDAAVAAASLLLGFVQAFSLMVRRRPSVVISVGGYAAAPAVFSALFLGVPVVLVESNAVPGLVHRLTARFAAASAVAWPGTRLRRAIVTGNPVRSSVTAVDRTPERRRAAKRELGFDDERPLVAVVGGSLGARRINAAVAGLPPLWNSEKPVSLLHVVGRRDWEDETLRGRSANGLDVLAVAYEERMDVVYMAADLMVCRAGATTVAELTAAAVPAVLIPLPHAPGDHQTANADVLARVGAAEMLTDEECTPESLLACLDGLLFQTDRLVSMSHAATSLAKPDAAHAVADVVRSVLASKGLAGVG